MKWKRNLGIFPWHSCEKIPLLLSGEPFFNSLLHLIQEAQKTILFQIYIFEPDETGKIVFDALIQAAERGVSLHIVLDAFGSKNFPADWVNRLKQKGAKISFFSTFKFAFKFHTGTRLHHKIIVFDQYKALIGGINISNHYSHFGNQQTWLDFGVLLEGNIALDLWQICLQTERKIFSQTQNPPYLPETGNIKARILQNHWAKARFGISKQYRVKIREAKSEIQLMASYFIPSRALKRMLKKAQKRGVNVTLILSGVSDIPLVRRATHYFYSDLLKSGIQIIEWNASILHAKLAIIDQEWTTIGSYNMNQLSDFGSTECNIEIENETYSKHCLQVVQNLLKDSAQPVDADYYLTKISILERSINFLSYQLMQLSFRLLFFFQNDLKSPFKRP